MFRQYDFECVVCRNVATDLVDVPHNTTPPKHQNKACPVCNQETKHDKLIGLPAPYMGEKVYNPQISGGSFDTMGNRKSCKLPTIPTEAFDTKDPKKLADNCKQHFSTPEYKEAERKRNQTIAENKQKKQRAAALERGESVNIRRDKLPGDPSFS
jgi:hypothetical protein